MSSFKDIQFGAELREKQFSHHNSDVIRLNNGSFGSAPKDVLDVKHVHLSSLLGNPDDFWHALDTKFKECSRAVAEGLLLDVSQAPNVCVVDNLTVAMSVITSSIIATERQTNSVVLVTSLTYNAVKLAVQHACDCSDGNVTMEVVNIPFPLFGDDVDDVVLVAYEQKLQQLRGSGKRLALCIIDHISSLPCMRMPVEALVNMCRTTGGAAEIVVDGAHAPGNIDLSIVPTTLGADYYVGNVHKWCFAPQSAAMLWVSPSAPSRAQLHHPVVSHRFGEGIQGRLGRNI